MNPYRSLSQKCFWKPAVANRNLFTLSDLWTSKFSINSQTKIVTFGSCFAQHISTALRQYDFLWLNTESAPDGLSTEIARKYNYGVFSSRTGNIYTTSLLLQWTQWALGIKEASEEQWQSEGRFYDPFRPNIEPNGFDSVEEMLVSRSVTLDAFKQTILQADYFIFTLGLTESWFNIQHGHEYPMCPGTVAGEYNAEYHQFKNQQFEFIHQNLLNALSLMREINKNLKFILTVSPVPLTATKSGNHVLVATMESKSILRAVAGQLATNHDFVDYFPSYEIINSPIYKGIFFEPNQRQVSVYGVNHVMDVFFKGLDQQSDNVNMKNKEASTDEAEVCEEALLEAFSKK